MAEQQHLFLSFSGLLYKLDRGEVLQQELDTGLFYFGCSRKHAYDPGASGEYNEVAQMRSPNAHRVHQQLCRALYKGEEDGRVLWRSTSQQNTYQQLNELLVKYGYEPIQDIDYNYYSYPGVRRKMEEQQIPLIVIS